MYYLEDFYYYDPYSIYRQYKVPAGVIQDHLNKGHAGHCFRSTWGGRQHTFNLVSMDAYGMVTIIENGVTDTVHHEDMVGLAHLGPQCPPSRPRCRWVWTPSGRRWVCN